MSRKKHGGMSLRIAPDGTALSLGPAVFSARLLLSALPSNFSGNSQRRAHALPPADARITLATLLGGGGVQLSFSSGDEGVLSAAALAALTAPAAHPRAAWAAAARPWPVAAAAPPPVPFDSLCTPAGATAARAALAEHGLLCVSSAPSVLAVASALGVVFETNYGRAFDVRAERDPNNTAFSCAPLAPHTDNPYRTPVPGFQALACITAAARGGATTFADGAALAAALRAASPSAFEALSSVDVEFAWSDARAAHRATRRVLELDADGLLVSVNWNDRAQRAPAAAAADAWFDAAGAWSRLLEGGAHVVSLALQPGDAVVWDNRRLLHGREAYEDGAAAAAPRWLQGAYLTEDSVLGAWTAARAAAAAVAAGACGTTGVAPCLSPPTSGGMAAPPEPLLLRPTPLELPLSCMPRGLQLVRYGGGDGMAAAAVLLHLSAPLPRGAGGAWAPLREAVRAAAAAALARAHAEGGMAAGFLPAAGASAPPLHDGCFEVALVVSAPPPPAAHEGAPPLSGTRACLFHHGWLHGGEVGARAASGGGGGVQAFPLIGAFCARGCVRADPGDGDAWDDLAAPLAAAAPPPPPPLQLAPFDQHAHTVEVYNGLGREGYIAQRVAELGEGAEEAAAAADAEAAAAGMQGWHVGADGARAQFAGAGAGAVWVACVDARRGGEGAGAPAPAPRALLTLLLVVADPAAQAAVRAVADGVGEAGAAPRDVLARLAAAAPALAPLLEAGAAEPF
jgi:hypothetical protein